MHDPTDNEIRKMRRKLEKEIDELMDIHPDSDHPVSEKKAKEGKVLK